MTNQTVTDEAFNKYCADVMGYRIDGLTWYKGEDIISSGDKYCPFHRLEQRAEVFDKLYTDTRYGGNHQNWQGYYLYTKGIDVATRDFIISTMSVNND